MGLARAGGTGELGLNCLISRGSKKLVGFDTSPGLMEGLRKGEIQALVVQNPKKMGHEAVKALVAKMKGGQSFHNCAARVTSPANCDRLANFAPVSVADIMINRYDSALLADCNIPLRCSTNKSRPILPSTSRAIP